MISKDQLHQCMPNASLENLEKFSGPIGDAMQKYGINTPQRMACFLAQWAHESGELRYTKELASGKAYEGRKDLGNVQPGDGVKFKGRGLPQLTGRVNYQAYSDYLKMPVIMEHPEMLEGPVYASDVAGWFWDTHNLNIFADKMDFLTISKRINGVNKKTGLPNGMVQRLAYLVLSKKAFGI
jgi:putative chitinase